MDSDIKQRMKSITIQEIEKTKADTAIIVDIRKPEDYNRNTIPHAVNIPIEQFQSDIPKLDRSKKIYILCYTGEKSEAVVEKLVEAGYDASNIEGGYRAFLRRQLTRLVQEGDKIAVCISGGKDSMLMAKLFQELQRHGKIPFELVFLVMNPGYNEDNWKIIQDNAKLLGIPLTVFESDIFNIVAGIDKNPCYLCARMRRGYKVETMMPKLHSTNFEGMELIRPLYLVKEADIKAWRDYNRLNFIQCACRFTENCTSCGGGRGSKRDEMKELIAKVRVKSDVIENNIFRSVHNINLRTVIGYHKDGEYYNFLDDYENK